MGPRLLPEPRERNVILRTHVGSEAFGTSTDASDIDLMGIFVESPQEVFGSREPIKTIVNRDQPEGVRSQPGDTDETLYSLRHFLHLALKGNPHVLTPIFVHDRFVVDSTGPGRLLRVQLPRIVASRNSYKAFVGYMSNQTRRFNKSLEGVKEGHMPERPELVEKYGYDVKYASHILRLGYQGAEFLRSGTMTIPMEGRPLELVKVCRSGEYGVSEILTLIQEARHTLDLAYAHSTLPELPAYHDADLLSVDLHTLAWEWC